MPQSLAKVLIHIVFSTKYRAPWLSTSILPDLHTYMAKVARGTDCECFRAGGVADHVHLAVSLSRMVTIANFVEEVKTSSSKWLKTQSPDLESFAWQRGYAVFSVDPKGLVALCKYIDNQAVHHRQHDYKPECRKFLTSAGIVYDERYVWD